MNNNFRAVLNATLYNPNNVGGFILKNKNGESKTWSTGSYPKPTDILSLYNYNNRWAATDTSYQEIINETNNNMAMGILLGTGTAPVSNDDVWLENPLSNITYIQQSQGTNQLNQCFKSFTLKNSNSQAVTVTEIGWCGAMFNNDLKTIEYVLLHRELLPTPVTMQPNDIYTFTITLDTSTI